MNNVKYILRLTVTLLLITSFVAAALAGVNAITKDKIATIQQEKADAAKMEVLPGFDSFEETAFTGNDKVKAVYLPVGGDGSAYVVEVAVAGFGGDIAMMVGVKEGTVCGVSIVSQTETAGLGAVAADDNKGVAFRGQFAGKAESMEIGDIDTITGATITSKAVMDGVNAALAVKLG